jgi:hypothetical protein
LAVLRGQSYRISHGYGSRRRWRTLCNSRLPIYHDLLHKAQTTLLNRRVPAYHCPRTGRRFHTGVTLAETIVSDLEDGTATTDTLADATRLHRKLAAQDHSLADLWSLSGIGSSLGWLRVARLGCVTEQIWASRRDPFDLLNATGRVALG